MKIRLLYIIIFFFIDLNWVFAQTIFDSQRTSANHKVKTLIKKDLALAEEFCKVQLSQNEFKLNNGNINKLKYESIKLEVYYSLGKINLLRGDFNKAKSYFENLTNVDVPPLYTNTKQLEIWEKILRIKIKGMNELANICLITGELDNAYKIYDYLKSYGMTSNFEAKKGYYKHSFYYIYLNGLGNYYSLIGDYENAKKAYTAFILIMLNNAFDPSALEVTSKAYIDLSKINILEGKFDEAMYLSKKAHNIDKHRWTKQWTGNNYIGLLESSNSIAECYRLKGDFKKALQWSNKAYEIFHRKLNSSIFIETPVLDTRAMIFFELDSLKQAEYFFNESSKNYYQYVNKNFPYLTDFERAFFYKQNEFKIDHAKAFYSHLIFNINDKNPDYIQKLYEISLNTKGLLLNTSVKFTDKVYASTDSTVKKSYYKLKALKYKLSYLLNSGNNTNELGGIQEEIKTIEKRLRMELKIEEEEFITQNDILKAIPQNHELVDVIKCPSFKKENPKAKSSNYTYYTLGAESDYLFFISTNSNADLNVYMNPKENKLSDKQYIAAYNNSINFGINSPILYQSLFRIIENNTKTKNIIISGDGIYNLINLNTLSDSINYVIDKFNINSIVSAKELFKRNDVKLVFKDIILFGRPDFTSHKAKPLFANQIPKDLPGTEKEILAIDSVIGTSISTKKYLRINANEKTAKNMASTSVVHFATHGFFESKNKNSNPMQNSGLILALTDSSKEDGILTAYEASGLNLADTYLVVLSACETGQGESIDGDGVWGLQRAFQVAGVNYIVMSLFKVDDEITSKLMVAFYSNIVKGQSITDAFKNSQIEIKKQYVEPKFWGAFTLKGY